MFDFRLSQVGKRPLAEVASRFFITSVFLTADMAKPETTLPVAVETREEILRPLLRGGETYDELLRKMARQYEPETPEVNV